jgi:hypothetical protein
MSLLIVPLLYPDLVGLLNSLDPGDAICSDGILVSELIGGVSDSQGLCQPAEGGGTATFASCFPIPSSALRYCSGTFRGSNNGTRQLQQVATEILQRALSELPSPIDLHVFSDYQFDLFSSLKKVGASRLADRRNLPRET